MKGPDVKNVMLDRERRIRYEIMAYRKLQRHEMLDAVASLHQTLKRKRQKIERGRTYVILTIYH